MLTKIVNGESVTMSAAEEDAIRAEWAANEAAEAEKAAALAAVLYRRQRAVAYRDELGKEQGDYILTLGDVLDAIIAEMRARGSGVTAEFQAICDRIDAIKAEFPKPE